MSFADGSQQGPPSASQFQYQRQPDAEYSGRGQQQQQQHQYEQQQLPQVGRPHQQPSDTQQQQQPPTQQFASMGLNANAAAFVPNANAPAFVPSWLQKPAGTPASAQASPASAPPPAPAPVKQAPVEEPKKAERPPSAATAEAKDQKKEAEEKKEQKKEDKDGEKQTLKKSESYSAISESQSAAASAIVAEVKAELDPELFGEFYKEHLNVVFIGHVDAGKSTMGGNILYLTGMVDKRTMEKFEKEAKEAGRESWYLSWALDVDQKERAKGKTVECGKASFETEKRRYTILDAPGHKGFVPSMISGASQADVAVLVISARKGEFETGFDRGGQTREHAILVKTAGVSKLVVVVNKMDDSTVQWSKDRYDEICNKLSPFLKATGFNPKTEVVFLPVSGFSGANIKDRAAKDVCPWFEGPSLLELLDTITAVDRKHNNPLMMPISDKYKEMGTIVVGKIESGVLKKNQAVMIMPTKKMCEISACFNEHDDEIPGATCGDNIRLRLRGVEEEDIMSGFILCSPVHPAHAVTAFEAQVVILDTKNIIAAGYQAILHVHNVVEEVTFGELLHRIDKKTNRRSKRPPPFCKRGDKLIARFEAQQAVCVEMFADYPQLGRFTLRDESKTIAIGKITKLITE